jgi:aspartyl-tRNA(Asn)/glutamyl-tRNA(Gln) amidotransferase subunit A
MSAVEAIDAALARIAKHDGVLNSFTDVTAERARARARAVDTAIAAGLTVGPLAGVPFAVKNLFDVEGLPTRAGSKINRDLPPATRDATLIERMEAAGAVLVGALNMGEYAYDFTGENIHDGPSRNPHDPTRMSGGSSGGSGSAVGGGLVPIALGSDTNGSIRVPSSFCGIFGLKPTYGRLSRARSFPFVASLDHLGPFARSVADLALAYDAMQGPDPHDAACTTRPVEAVTPLLSDGLGDLRIAIAGGYFQTNLFPEARQAVADVAGALGVTQTIAIPEAARARAAAYVITTTEGASLHLDRLRKRPDDFDPAVRDRLLAGAMIRRRL